MMMENGLSPDYDDPAMYGNENSEYMMAAHYAQGGWVTFFFFYRQQIMCSKIVQV